MGPTNFFGPKIVKQKDFLDQTFVGPTFFDLRFFNQNIIESFLIQIFSYPSVLDGKHFYPIFLDHKLGLKNFLTKDFVWREHYFGPDFFLGTQYFWTYEVKIVVVVVVCVVVFVLLVLGPVVVVNVLVFVVVILMLITET